MRIGVWDVDVNVNVGMNVICIYSFFISWHYITSFHFIAKRRRRSRRESTLPLPPPPPPPPTSLFSQRDRAISRYEEMGNS